MRRRASSALRLALILLAGASLTWAGASTTRLTPENRVAILRTLAFEYATARQPMPASKGFEEALQVSSTGQVNQDKLRQDLANRGAAVYTGEIIQITGVQFQRNSIVFEINGGGKKKKKWWERVRVEAGPVGGPTVQREPSGPPPPPGAEPQRSSIGSWIRLNFSHEVPDLTPAEVKQLLVGALDFSRRSAAVPWIETIPEQFRQAVKDKKVLVGMNREMVLAAKGRPERKVREKKDGRETEDWMYGHAPFVTFVTFVEDEVVAVKEFR